ncbi:energy-coupling factor ABC transporter ATP-binding protein [Promethearchaeum syntrophicum]|uniref:Energy-coupling factor ABC transporter ATP-binding protein n=1 Tax=Promethearchaeum syntrophicum TaxID=2594042 RepID=A0A5B9DDV5_9ARCH|nr:ABC transporter ATP-binding protein [Candidatus Prometheoarchaeum syntrophicum]QEE17499.1 Cobalamin import ATP-binding protein BtuD [Candidatus Prometheoarchaeum syntrophicum]
MNEKDYNPIIEIENLSFAYKNDCWIIKEANFTVNKGEILGIAGPSGIGKTTLCYILKGIIPHSIRGNLEGNITINGLNIKKLNISKIARSVGMVFQNLNAQLFSNTVKEEIEFGLKNLKMDHSLAIPAMKKFKIEDLSNKSPINLSAGQKQRVILASILALKPKILILDEPAVYLDPPNKIRLKEWLIEQNQKFDTTILIASNNPWLIGEICDEILFFRNKTIEKMHKSVVMKEETSWRWTYT